MSDETKKMRAVFVDTRLLRACAWLAKRANYPLLAFTRNGDLLHVMGTNSYVLIEGDVSAEFEDWPDGEGKAVTDFMPTKLLARALKIDNLGYPCAVEFEGGCAKVEEGCGDASCKALFTNVRNPPAMKDVLNDDDAGPALMGIHGLLEGVRTMAKMGCDVEGWRIVTHGPNKAVYFTLDDAPLTKESNVRVLAMPRREAP